MTAMVTPAAYRWSIASRFIAAALGGYAVATLLNVAFMAVLPMPYYQSLLFSAQTAYLYYTGVIIWCFAARTAKRAWLGLGLVALPLVLIDAWYLIIRGLP